MITQPPKSTLIPYTTLFLSSESLLMKTPYACRNEKTLGTATCHPEDVESSARRRTQIGRAHVCTPVTEVARMPASAGKKKKRGENKTKRSAVYITRSTA